MNDASKAKHLTLVLDVGLNGSLGRISFSTLPDFSLLSPLEITRQTPFLNFKQLKLEIIHCKRSILSKATGHLEIAL
jgi:hypothetical protein